jgi:hypothetical protein
MKADEDVKNIKPDAVIMVAKATELFVELLTEQAYRHAVADKRKGLSYKVSRVARSVPAAHSRPRPARSLAWTGDLTLMPRAGPGRHRQGGREI